ncbi:hypothetical protein ACLBWP_16125 [Microbacterium sp. M1A1_1b]
MTGGRMMTNYSLRLECAATEAEDIESHVDVIAEAFFDTDGLDQDIAIDLSQRTMTFSLVVEAPSEIDALEAGIGAVRGALHAAGRGTPAWEDHYRMLRQEIEAETIQAV